MSTQDPTSTHDRKDMALGAIGSLLLNVGYVLLFHADQRMLLMLFATILVGMGLLVTETKGAMGMGIIIGTGLSIAAALSIAAVHGSIVHQ
jgi:hypothetical protein